MLCPSSYSRPRFHTLQTCPWRGQCSAICTRGSFLGNRILHQISEQPASNFFTPRAVFSGGGILGVGPSEIIVIVAVGWLVLGPKKLFALAKDSGKLLGELRRTAAEAKDTFTEAMEMDMLAEEADRLDTNLAPEKKKGPTGIVGEPTETGQQNLQNEKLNQTENPVPEGNPAVNSAFLDQLKRVSDPDQVSPGDIPDLAMEPDLNQSPTMEIPDLVAQEDEQEAFEKLEREYLAAKQKMDRKRAQASSKGNGSGENLSDKA